MGDYPWNEPPEKAKPAMPEFGEGRGLPLAKPGDDKSQADNPGNAQAGQQQQAGPSPLDAWNKGDISYHGFKDAEAKQKRGD